MHFSKLGQLEDLAQQMKKHNSEKFLMPVSDVHKEDMSAFQKSKVKVTTAVMYRTVSAEIPAEELKSYYMVCIFTAAGIQSLYDNCPDYVQGDQKIAVFGPQAAEVAEERGLRIDVKAPSMQYPSMPAALAAFLQE